MEIVINGDLTGLDYKLDLSRGSYMLEIDPEKRRWLREINLPVYPEGFGVFNAGSRHYTTRNQDTTLYQVFYTRAGSAKLNTASGEFDIVPNSVFMLNLNQPYTYHTIGEYWHHEWVNFRGGGCKAYYDLINPNGLRILSADSSNDISNVMLELRNRYRKQEPADLIDTCACISKLLGKLFALTGNIRSEPENDTARALSAAVRFLEYHYKERITIDELSDIAMLSKFYFLRAFKRRYGKTPMDYLCAIRLRHAFEQLLTTPDGIEQIALNCGFGDTKNLLYHFKQHNGTTPSEYRRRVIRD